MSVPGLPRSVHSLETGYSSLSMDVMTQRLVGNIRHGVLAAYLDWERGLHLWHARVAAAACNTPGRSMVTMPGRHVAGGQEIKQMYPGVDFDPDPGNTEARRTIRLTRRYSDVREARDGRPLVRDIIPGIEVYRLQPQEEVRIATYGLAGLAAEDRYMRGIIMGRDMPDVHQLFMGHPSGSSEVQEYVGHSEELAFWLGLAAAALEVPRQDIRERFIAPDVSHAHLS